MLLIVAALITATVVMVSRIDFVSLDTGDAQDGEVFLLLGTDAGIPRPAGDLQEAGVRADVVALSILDGDVARTLVIPRDLVVTDDTGAPIRLALTMNQGAPAVAQAICRELGVSVDHVVALDAVGFIRTVDALGGVNVDIAQPVRDTQAGLHITEAGEQTLTGEQALSLARSRHPEYLDDGSWVSVDESAGARVRVGSSAAVAAGVAAAAQDAAPLTLVAAGWEASAGLTLSHGTWPWDLARLATALETPAVLPTEDIAPGFEASTDASREALQAAGFSLGCGSR